LQKKRFDDVELPWNGPPDARRKVCFVLGTAHNTFYGSSVPDNKAIPAAEYLNPAHRIAAPEANLLAV
jgi:hypothetical protein